MINVTGIIAFLHKPIALASIWCKPSQNVLSNALTSAQNNANFGTGIGERERAPEQPSHKKKKKKKKEVKSVKVSQ